MKVRKCLRCTGPIASYQRVCSPCSAQRYIRSRHLSGGTLAHAAVARARKSGLLADPTTGPCADCGWRAIGYDHRDYNEPLRVDPVCQGCNVRRGKAAPKVWAPGEWAAYVERQITAATPRHIRHAFQSLKVAA